jgi:calcineurin-like phosphoesterase family protein
VAKKNSFITLVPGNTCPDAKTLQVTFLKKMAAYKNIYYKGRQGILTEGGRLSTVDLLIKACFVKKENNIFDIKQADLN